MAENRMATPEIPWYCRYVVIMYNHPVGDTQQYSMLLRGGYSLDHYLQTNGA